MNAVSTFWDLSRALRIAVVSGVKNNHVVAHVIPTKAR
jgi:hypothetical protein